MSSHYLVDFLFLLPMGILAGIVSTTAGLASLVSYPALLAIGVPPVFANVTNTAALFMTGIGSTLSSRKELGAHRKELLHVLPLTVGGSILGAWLLLAAPATTFTKVVPFFVLVAAILLFLQVYPIPYPGRREKQAAGPSRLGQVLKSIAILGVGAYCGYFGAAGGVMMLAILAATTTMNFSSYNALKNVSLGLSNLTAAIIYAFSSHIYWALVVPLGIGLFCGGYIGPKIVRIIPEKVLKLIVSILALGLALQLFWKAYL
ncbi:sulfite exporter TauE/SafE family protein [Leuconostocaceae bacterium ESL0958]|nr:sulfite exporter TauE/SafE family protein [Leuconostocaceae bacterium ESL0958]